MQLPDSDLTGLVQELSALPRGDRDAIVARLPAYQRPYIDRAVHLLAAGGSADALDRFSPDIALRLADITRDRSDAGDRTMTAATRATLLKALAEIEDGHPLTGVNGRGHASPSLLAGVVGLVGRRTRR